jgi:sugar/nucleoside kinase (ribokinase family)
LGKKLDLLAIGGITLDQIFKVSRLPEKHFEAEVIEFGTFFGGRAPNVAAMAAKIGLKTGIVSAVGQDFTDSGYDAHLRKLGVDLRGVIKVPEQKTKQILIFSDPKGDQITFFHFGAEKHFEKMGVPVDLIKESKIVHISSSGDYKFNINCAKVAHDNNVSVSFDPGNDPFTEIPEYLKGVISRTFFLFMNDVEVPGILERLELSDINELLTYGPSVIAIINKKDKSSRIYAKRTVENIPSAIKKIVDATGASDGYAAGFLSGYTKTHDLRIAGMLGAVEASFIVEDFGCQTNLPNWKELSSRCKAVFNIAL